MILGKNYHFHFYQESALFMSANYRSIAMKDTIEFAQFLCDENVDLYQRGYPSFSFTIMIDGKIKRKPPFGLWPDEVPCPAWLLQNLRSAGLTGLVLISVLPEGDGTQLGLEIQVDDSNFYPLLPNPIASSYSSLGYMGADSNVVYIPREPHPGRYYFPNLITLR